MIFLTGDTHGEMGIHRFVSDQWPVGTLLTKDDYVIVLGDFGLLWSGGKNERHWLKWLHEKPWTTLFLDGNHENFNMIDKLESRQMFGADVGVVNESVFHLRRGRAYNIDGNNILTIGGAQSIDKIHRIPEISWWEGELLSLEDVQRSWDTMADNLMKFDYILTHTCPKFVLTNFGIVDNPYRGQSKATDPVSFQLQDMCDVLQYKHWYFGHMHENRTMSYGMDDSKFTCLFEDIIKLGDVI